MRRLLVVEDDARLCELLRSLVEAPGWMVRFAGSAAEALRQVEEAPGPEVVLLDLGLPDLDGVTLIERLVAGRPDLPIVVVTVCADEGRILAALRAGARGYLFKEELGRSLAPALEEAAAGGAPMSPKVARLVLEALRGQGRREVGPVQALTDRERRVLEQLSLGLTYDQVARTLEISPNTVRSYVRSIYEKLSVGSKTEAVMAAMRLGLIAQPHR